MRRSIALGVPVLSLVVLLVAGVVLIGGCYPKSQVYGVGNEGGLVFNVNPPEAEVVLDGVGQGPSSAFTQDRYLKVSPGKHRLELRLDGYETYSREIYVANSLLRIEAGLIRR
ncbi:MAG: PEGA domain-containing protein [Deltaproteobacteria bacterium]|nr:PEGA domain-containing protein [Deltaproteobacteria bacterium]